MKIFKKKKMSDLRPEFLRLRKMITSDGGESVAAAEK